MIIYIEAKAGASKNEFSVIDEHTLRVRIKAPAVDGKANKELISYLAEIFNVSKSKVKLLKGHTSRFKKIELDDGSDFSGFEKLKNRG